MSSMFSNQNIKESLKIAYIISIVLVLTLSGAFVMHSMKTVYASNEIQSEKQRNIEKNSEFKTESNIIVKKAEISVVGIIIRIVIICIILGILYVLFICSPYFKIFRSGLDPTAVIEQVTESKNSEKKILVGYITEKGATASIAKKIYDILMEKGFNVDLRFIPNIKDDENLSKYDSFILGSAVYYVMAKEYKDFLVKNREVLSKKTIAIFVICGTIQRVTEKNIKQVETYYDSALKHVPEIKPVAKEAFAGNLDLSKLNFAERQFLNALFTVTPLKGGDHRDFNKVAEWTEGISTML
ncbi:flavodoxin domain-containing protein [Spirochaetota bacterium]